MILSALAGRYPVEGCWRKIGLASRGAWAGSVLLGGGWRGICELLLLYQLKQVHVLHLGLFQTGGWVVA